MQTVILLLNWGVTAKTVELIVELLKPWSSVRYRVSAFDEVVSNHTIGCALHHPTSCRVCHQWHNCMFSQTGLNRSILPYPQLNISAEIFVLCFQEVWLGNFFNVHTFEIFLTLCSLHKRKRHLCLHFVNSWFIFKKRAHLYWTYQYCTFC